MKSEKIRKTLLLPFSLLPLAFAANAADLPAGYTELESISSTGTQYIDTGYTHKANTKIVCEVSVASEQPSGWAGIFGARKNSYQSNAFCFFAKCDNDANKACYNRSGNEMRSATAIPKGVRTTLTCEGANATWTTVDGTGGGIVTTGTCDDGSNTMFVFNLNTADADGKRADASPCVMTLYSFRIYEGETLVREFVPCLNGASEVGLYEMQTGEFHANQGSGMFACSPEPRVSVRIPTHTTGVWTSGAGTKTNDIVQGQFRVLPGTENVTVVLTAMERYYFTDKSETKTVVLGRVSADVASDDARYADCGTDIDPVKYIDANGDEQICANYELVTAGTSVLTGGWYVVEGVVSRTGIDVASWRTVHLVLADGASLTVTGDAKDIDRAGIGVPAGAALNIYAQRGGTGAVSAKSEGYGAGIGGGYNVDGGAVVINGGTVTAVGCTSSAGIGGGYCGDGGTVVVNGGRVDVRGGSHGAGIGGGGGGSGGIVTVNGGVVTAAGGSHYCAGIGGGNGGAGGTVTINGGTVTASGGRHGAGIGGGYGGDGGTVTINGGTVTANGGYQEWDHFYETGLGGAGIGGGERGPGGIVTINGGTVTANGGYDGAGIGGGCNGAGGTVTINGGTVTASSAAGGAGIGCGLHSEDPGTVTFGADRYVGVFVGENEANRVYVPRTAYASDHSAANVWICKNLLTILSAAFCTGDVAAVVEPIHEGDSVVGHRVTLRTDHTEGVTLPTDVGAVTINLNGWTIRGAEGVAGTATSPGGKGGAAITVAGTSGANAGETTIAVTSAIPGDATGTPTGAASAVGDVMVVDLERNDKGRFPVRFYRGVDMGVFNCDAYKTSKIALRRIQKGVAYPVEARATSYPITKTLVPQRDFYVGLFEITDAQYDRVMGAESPSASMTPKRYASYSAFRSPTGSTQLDPPSSDKFIGILLADAVDASGNPAGGFDLPTANQWEIAARAGATGEFGAYLDENGLLVEGTAENVAEFAQTGSGHVVGSLRPNAWGLYDMCGGVGEWCRTSGNDVETAVKDSYWPLRGNAVTSWEIGHILSGYKSWTGYSGVNCGARLSCTLDVSESVRNDVGGVCGGKGGDGNPPGAGGVPVADANGNEVAVDDLLGLCANGTFGNPLVLIPNHVNRTYVVSNLTTRAEIKKMGGEGGAGGALYALPLGSKVAIYTVAKHGYEVVRSEPYVIESVTLEVVLDADKLEQSAEIAPILYMVTCKLEDDIAKHVSVDVAVDGVSVAKCGEGWPVADGRTATVTFTPTTGRVFAIWPQTETYSVEVEISGRDPDAVTCPRLLPFGFSPLQSISSTGTQYIDTGYAHKANTKIVCEVSVASKQPSGWAGIFGARKNSYQSNAFCFFAKCDNDANKACYNRSGSEMRSATAFPKGVKTTLTCEGANATWTTVDGTSDSIATTGTCDDGANTMFVFNLNTADADGKRADASPCAMTLYSFRIYEGETFVREFVPCLNDALEAGLYEMRTDEFHANQGTGAFSCDPDPWAVVRIPAYVEGVWTSGDGTVTNGIDGGSFRVLKGTENVKVILAPDPAYTFASGAKASVVEFAVVNEDVGPLEFPETIHRRVEYVDENGELRTNDTFSVVTAATAELTGGWYLVEGTVERGGIAVAEGRTTHLILADGASLTVLGGDRYAGIYVSCGKTLAIYGQRDGTGRLSATGGYEGAGIGGGALSDAGTIRIHGGTITATGGDRCAGIGCGYCCSADMVEITGGCVNAIAGRDASRIGLGYVDGYTCPVSISGGVFAHQLEDGWLADGYESIDNPDPRTRAAYPFAVLLGATVTVGELRHMTAAWTSADGTVTNAIGGAVFKVQKGTENVKVIFTADQGYSFGDGAITAEVVVGRVDADCSVMAPEVQMSEIETFGRGWYVTVPRGAYVDTLFRPDSNTRVEMDVSVQGAGEYWFGCWDRNYNDGAFAFGNDGWGIYVGYGNQGGTFGEVVGNGRHAVELDRNVVKVDGQEVHAYSVESFASLANNLYLFAQNRRGTSAVAESQNTIVCYGCRIWTNGVDGAAVPVRNFVPARTKDERRVVGLYDTVTEAFYANQGTGELSCDLDPWAVVRIPAYVEGVWTSGDGTVTNVIVGGSFRVLKGTENVKVICTPKDPVYVFASGAKTSVVELDVVNEDVGPLEFPETIHRRVEYVDENGELRTNDTFSVVTAATAQLADGWYLVEGTVECGGIDVAAGCTAHLILADGASLMVQGEFTGAGIDVRQGETLNIYAQRCGTGRLTAAGGYDGAGIGGGWLGDGGMVTINGGTVTATGGEYGAGIGGGFKGDGGVVTINGGTVTATGGYDGAGIGGGYDGAGRTVTISGGAVNAVAGLDAVRIGPGYGGKVGDVELSGGVFAHELEDGWLADGFGCFANSDPKTRVDYPYVVLPVATVTVGELNHMTAAWTSGDGLKTNVIGGTTFAVEKGTENVKVIFTAQAPFCFADGAIVVEVAVGTIENDRSVAVPVVRQPTIETFGEGGYLESSGGAWIDTEYVHTSTTRVEGVMSIAEDQPSSWAAIFGARKNSYQSNAFCFFAKCDNDVNKACYNRSGNEMRSTAAFPKGVKTTLTCEGSKATWTNEYGTDGIVTTGTCDGGVNTLFVFNLNTADAAGKRADTSPCAMKLYAFRICEGETLVRDFVPARTKDVRKIPGLYDRITGEFFANCGDGDFTLGYDGPTCEGGTIEWCDAANAWVVTPTNGAAAVTVAGLPSDAKVSVPVSLAQVNGVADEQIMVRSGGYDITGAFTVSGGGIALNPNGVVTIGGETIPVKPTIGELGCFDGEPFAVGENGASITIRTIPGLFYGFRKGSSLSDGEFAVLVWAKAVRTNLSFTDKSQPEQVAFYDIEVRAYVAEPIPSDGGFEIKSEIDPAKIEE